MSPPHLTILSTHGKETQEPTVILNQESRENSGHKRTGGIPKAVSTVYSPIKKDGVSLRQEEKQDPSHSLRPLLSSAVMESLSLGEGSSMQHRGTEKSSAQGVGGEQGEVAPRKE